MPTSRGDYLLELPFVHRCRLFAKHMLSGGKSAQAEFGVRIGMRGNIDRIEIHRKQRIQRGSGALRAKSFREGCNFLGGPPPDGRQRSITHRGQALCEPCGGASGAHNPPTDSVSQSIHAGH